MTHTMGMLARLLCVHHPLRLMKLHQPFALSQTRLDHQRNHSSKKPNLITSGDSANISTTINFASSDAFLEYVSTLADRAVSIHTELRSSTALDLTENPAP